MIKKEFGYDVNYTVAKLDNEFGPTITHGPVEALIASSETSHKGNEINNIRRKSGLNPHISRCCRYPKSRRWQPHFINAHQSR